MRTRVEALVADIPRGRVMTYGDVAACAGFPGAARRVGALAHEGTTGLPWHRVVASGGRLAAAHDLDPEWQSTALGAEGVRVKDGKIQDFPTVQWYPDVM